MEPKYTSALFDEIAKTIKLNDETEESIKEWIQKIEKTLNDINKEKDDNP